LKRKKRYHNVIQPGRPTWDPGRDQDPADPESKLFKTTIPTQVYSLLDTIMEADDDLVLNDEEMEADQSMAELDPHANMPACPWRADMPLLSQMGGE
jgi:hypothetical protein